MPTIALLQRRMFGEILHVFVLCVLGLLAIMLMGRGVQLSELFLGLQISLLDMVVLFVYLSPTFLLLVIPISCMLSIFLTFLRMNSDRELIALKAGGVSLYQMLPASLIFSCLCGLVTLWISIYGVSAGMVAFRATVIEIASTRAKIIVQPGVFNSNIPGFTLFARQVDAENNAMRQVFIKDNSAGETPLIITAPSGSITTDADRGDLLLNLYNGTIYQTDKAQISEMRFGEYTLRLELASLFTGTVTGLRRIIQPKEMSVAELRKIRANPQDSIQARGERFYFKALVELQKRFVFPAACLVLGLFAVPLGCAFEGMRRHLGIVLTLVMFMVYYSLLSFGVTLGQGGDIPITPVMWMPNVLFFSLAVFGLRLAARERAILRIVPGVKLFRRLQKRRKDA